MDEQVTKVEPSKNPQVVFLQTLIDSKKLPGHIKTVEEAFTISQMGKELGFPTMQAFHYIIPIQGRLSLSAKALGKKEESYTKNITRKEDGIYVYPDGSTDVMAPKADGTKPIDRRTTIEFYRDNMTEITSFTWKDASDQGLTTKDNWKRMPKEMLFARCLSKGANRIGPDLLLGLYTVEEMVDTFLNENQVKRNEDGSVAEVIDITATQTK